MSRPHTMFIQAQALPWEAGRIPPWQGAETRILSRDAQSGAASLLVRYPPGWRIDDDFVLSAGEELFVLAGDFSVGEHQLAHNGYAWLPAGYLRKGAESRGGAVVLAMYDSQPLIQQISDSTVQPGVLADIPASGLEGWTENPYTRYLPGTGVWPLRENKQTGEISILYSSLPYRYMEHRWAHDNVQEMYLLAGEYVINDVGRMRPGAYAWWEPGNVHGPYGSRTGFLMLVRAVGGPLTNIIDEERIPVNYSAPYNPQLPDEFRGLAQESEVPECY